MQQEEHSFSKTPITMSFDDFEISAESFKPVTKGLGFHQEQKKTTFKPVVHTKLEPVRQVGPLNNITKELDVKIKKQGPMGLEAFYSASTSPAYFEAKEIPEVVIPQIPTVGQRKAASFGLQLSAWLVDLIIILALVGITGASLILASGIDYPVMLKLIAREDLAIFSSSIFAIYYILYFTILDISASPGKVLFGLKLIGIDSSSVSVKNTFIRAIVSLVSVGVFCLPLLLDFQGRLSDTKLVK